MNTTIYDFEEIKKILPHRYPFIFLDRMVMEENGEAVAYKNVTNCEYLFVDPQTKKRTFPPLFIIEAMGQAGIIFFDRQVPNLSGKHFQYLFAGLDDVEFYADVLPGDKLQLRIQFDKIVSNATIISALATVNDKLVAKAKLSVSIREK